MIHCSNAIFPDAVEDIAFREYADNRVSIEHRKGTDAFLRQDFDRL